MFVARRQRVLDLLGACWASLLAVHAVKHNALGGGVLGHQRVQVLGKVIVWDVLCSWYVTCRVLVYRSLRGGEVGGEV